MSRKRNIYYDNAYSLYLKGYSLNQVSLELGVTRQCVYKAFKLRGFSLRGPDFKPFQVFDKNKFTLRDTGYYALSNGKRILMHRYVWEFHNGKIPKGFDIHHKNRDRADNRISNLELISHSDHAKRYSTGNNQYTKCN